MSVGEHERDEISIPAWRARIADPKPPACSGCLRGADAEAVFVEFATPSGRGYIREFGTGAVIADLNRMALCDACVREMAECLAYEPTLYADAREKNRNLAAERDRLFEENRKLRELVFDPQDG